jgi:hypothetical protein
MIAENQDPEIISEISGIPSGKSGKIMRIFSGWLPDSEAG